eukprot:TRINITY_DN63369_c0_g2_i1.p1 TRINITY_DN63369_c0_g2~~TRINITY_DN63369_c0_g2_i1.p1  ORF type:complete len:248 (+),score=25.98 TRINITY_DN63369_c0_g2_i1:43-744(+)
MDMLFDIDEQTGCINFPQGITSVSVESGAGISHFMGHEEEYKRQSHHMVSLEPSVVLTVAARRHFHSSRHITNIPVAAGTTDPGYVPFYPSPHPQGGALQPFNFSVMTADMNSKVAIFKELPTAMWSPYWVPTLAFSDILSLIPTNVTLTKVHLRANTAEITAFKSAGLWLKRAGEVVVAFAPPIWEGMQNLEGDKKQIHKLAAALGLEFTHEDGGGDRDLDVHFANRGAGAR